MFSNTLSAVRSGIMLGIRSADILKEAGVMLGIHLADLLKQAYVTPDSFTSTVSRG